MCSKEERKAYRIFILVELSLNYNYYNICFIAAVSFCCLVSIQLSLYSGKQTDLISPHVRRAEATDAGGNRPLVCQRELKDPKHRGGPSSASHNLPWHLMGDVNWRCCFGVPQPGLKVHLSTAEAPGRRAPDPPASDPINHATLWLFVSHFHVNTARKVCV